MSPVDHHSIAARIPQCHDFVSFNSTFTHMKILNQESSRFDEGSINYRNFVSVFRSYKSTVSFLSYRLRPNRRKVGLLAPSLSFVRAVLTDMFSFVIQTC